VPVNFLEEIKIPLPPLPKQKEIAKKVEAIRAEIAEIKELAAYGLLDGVTTNPSLIAKSGRDFKEVIAEICKIIDGPVSAEVAATNYEGMIALQKM
jgi:transaldolase